MTRVISAHALGGIVRAICRQAGSAEREAELVADHLVAANLAGHDSHGIGMMPAYVNALQNGRLRPNVELKVAVDAGPYLLLDGGIGFGQAIAYDAMVRGIARARDHGVCVLGLRSAHHIGRIGAWGEMCAEAGFVSIHYVNAAVRRIVAPYGGSDARFTTNPYCTAIPATARHPRIVLDMATSKVAMGKVRVAYNQGVEVPPGSLIDGEGNDTNDPGVMFRQPRGALLSMGLHKGYGLALVCELLAGAMTGGGTFHPDKLDENTIVNNMLTIILDPTRFTDRESFEREVDSFVDWVKASPPRPGFDAVLVAGDPERISRERRMAEGVPVDDQTWQDIVAAAAALGLNNLDPADYETA